MDLVRDVLDKQLVDRHGTKMGRVDGIAPAEVRIGLPVCARIVQEDDQPLLVFVPDAPAGEETP